MKIFSMVLIVAGLAILISNAVDYLGGFFGFSWEYHLPSSAIGTVFIGIGMYQMRIYEATKKVKNTKP